MTLFVGSGSPASNLSTADLRHGLREACEQLGPRPRVIAVPPDFTRFESRAGQLTCVAHEYYGDSLTDVMPAIGTHFPMSEEQLETMFPALPKSLIRVHRWRHDVETVGEVPADFVSDATGGRYRKPWVAQMNRLIARGGHDLILSIGQVVPHEVLGMANFNKNIFIGTGGQQGINDSHFISAICGIEDTLGRTDNPLRRILNEAERRFCGDLPLVYVLTVVGLAADGGTAVRGLFIGDDSECFEQAAALSAQVNITALDEPVERMVAYLDPEEFHSTWIGNKSIYRTRMAIADGGELVVLAPGVKTFGEDPQIDRLIRKYGYRSTPDVLRLVDQNADLAANLGTAAHLMHSASEGRFRVVYCAGGLSRQAMEDAGLQFGDIHEYGRRYPADKLLDGWHDTPAGERFYLVRKPALGLWAHRSRLPF